MKYTLIQKILINITLILLNAVVFSGSFAGINIFSGGAADILVGIIVVLFTISVFIKVNGIGFIGKYGVKYSRAGNSGEPATLEQCEAELKSFYNYSETGHFDDNLSAIIEQIGKFKSKRNHVKGALSELFEDTEITYSKFNASIENVEAIVIRDIIALLKKIKILGENVLNERKGALYDELVDHMSKTVVNHNDILLKMDKLLIELSVFSAQSAEERNQNSAASELLELIDSVKWYR